MADSSIRPPGSDSLDTASGLELGVLLLENRGIESRRVGHDPSQLSTHVGNQSGVVIGAVDLFAGSSARSNSCGGMPSARYPTYLTAPRRTMKLAPTDPGPWYSLNTTRSSSTRSPASLVRDRPGSVASDAPSLQGQLLNRYSVSSAPSSAATSAPRIGCSERPGS